MTDCTHPRDLAHCRVCHILPIKPLSDGMALPEIKDEDLELRQIDGVLSLHKRLGVYAQGVDQKDAIDKLKSQIKHLGYGKPAREKCAVELFLEEISDNLEHVASQKDSEARVYGDPWVAGAISARAESIAFTIAAHKVKELTRDLTPKFLAKAPHCDYGK